MGKITKLTAEQEQRLVAFREEWRQLGLCCDPADFETGDEVIRGSVLFDGQYYVVNQGLLDMMKRGETPIDLELEPEEIDEEML